MHMLVQHPSGRDYSFLISNVHLHMDFIFVDRHSLVVGEGAKCVSPR